MSHSTALLGLESEPSVAEVKAAFRELSLLHHPDAGGDPEKFQLLRAAYEIALAEAEERPCPSCRGRKKVTVQRGWTATEIPCDDCGGKGYL
jgi:DnaJ-class molecular chaperone